MLGMINPGRWSIQEGGQSRKVVNAGRWSVQGTDKCWDIIDARSMQKRWSVCGRGQFREVVTAGWWSVQGDCQAMERGQCREVIRAERAGV